MKGKNIATIAKLVLAYIAVLSISIAALIALKDQPYVQYSVGLLLTLYLLLVLNKIINNVTKYNTSTGNILIASFLLSKNMLNVGNQNVSYTLV